MAEGGGAVLGFIQAMYLHLLQGAPADVAGAAHAFVGEIASGAVDRETPAFSVPEGIAGKTTPASRSRGGA